MTNDPLEDLPTTRYVLPFVDKPDLLLRGRAMYLCNCRALLIRAAKIYLNGRKRQFQKCYWAPSFWTLMHEGTFTSFDNTHQRRSARAIAFSSGHTCISLKTHGEHID